MAPQKKPSNVVTDTAAKEPCRLLQALQQYGLLSGITSYLFPKDLFALAATSKAAHRMIFSSKDSRSTLLKKMACDGKGVRLRNSLHKKSKYFTQFDCTSYVQCGTHDLNREVESRPCTSCKRTTCDECRVHCVYQSHYQPPDEPDELPNFSGFALLSSQEMGIISPLHLGRNDTASWVDASATRSKPHHDQGFLDLPLEAGVYAAPESVAEILDFNLGSGPLQFSRSSDSPHPSPVLQPFWDVTEQRKRSFCGRCFLRECESISNGYPKECQCTLRARFLDRWLCLCCYRREISADKKFSRGAKLLSPAACSCGRSFQSEAARIVCLWCRGEAASSAVPP